MAKRQNNEGGPVVIDLTESRFERVHGGEATPEETRRYFEERVVNRSRDESTTEPLYKKVLRDLAEKGTATTADLLEEDRMYADFCAQSGMDDFLGRTPATGATADLSQAGEPAESTGTDDAGEEEAMWRSFVAESGTGWMFGESGEAGAADLSEGQQADKRAESMREQAETDELHRSLREQNGHAAAGDGSELSDEAAWAAYRDALGLDR